MSNFANVTLGRNTKQYSHKLIFDVNTTFNFGLVQPKYCTLMDAKDEIHAKFSELLRLAPLPVPTMGDVYEETYTRFVPAVEVCPWYSFIRGQKPYTFPSGAGSRPSIPVRVPVISNAILVNYLITHFCDANFISIIGEVAYEGELHSDIIYANDESLAGVNKWQALQQIVTTFYKTILPGKSDTFSYFDMPSDGQLDLNITLNNADFILPVGMKFGLFRLNAAGRQLRKILIGLGYGLNICDNDTISLLPILAFYKAYFDTYNPQRTTSWLQTKCYAFIKWLEMTYLENASLFNSYDMWKGAGSDFAIYFNAFMQELKDTIPTENLNYVSAHRDSPTNDLSYTFSAISNDATAPNVVKNVAGVEGNLVPTAGQVDKISLVLMNLIARATHFIAKDTAIGNKISTWLQIHGYGDLDNSLFRDSNKCSYHRLEAPITALFSTSDTVTDAGTGEYLGAYAGKSMGTSFDNKFDFTAPSSGFFIVLSCVMCDSMYTNGNDGTLYCVDKDTMFIDEYDALGFEVTSKNQIFSDGGVAYDGSNPNFQAKVYINNLNDNGFGFIPRYSRMKQHRGVVNGDMSLRGTSANMSSYYLDKIVSNVEISDDGQGHMDMYLTRIPEASENFQYFNKFRWLGNYDRIFYNSGNYLEAPEDDNFISQTRFEIVLKNRLKPISQSYDTFDDSHDNSTTTIQQS